VLSNHLITVHLLLDPDKLYDKGTVKEKAFVSAIKALIAKNAGISPTRISNVEIFEEVNADGQGLRVWLVLHARPENIDKPSKSILKYILWLVVFILLCSLKIFLLCCTHTVL